MSTLGSLGMMLWHVRARIRDANIALDAHESSCMAEKRISGLQMHAWGLEKGLHTCSAGNLYTRLHATHRADVNGMAVLAVAPAFVHAGGLVTALHNI